MTSIHVGRLAVGVLLMAGFLVVLVLMFAPIVDGQNAFNYLDGLYNSISKGSADYRAHVGARIQEHPAQTVSLALTLPDPTLASRTALLLEEAGAAVAAVGTGVDATFDLGRVLSSCLQDAGELYENRGQAINARYGLEGRAVVYAWWRTLRELERELTRQRLFAGAELVRTVNLRIVEPAYNYHGIEAQHIGDRWVVVLASLAFYVVYTVWYGYAVMFLFEGLGMRIGHAEDAEPKPRRRRGFRMGRLAPRGGG